MTETKTRRAPRAMKAPPVDPILDPVVELILEAHPQTMEHVVNLGPNDAIRGADERRTVVARLRMRGYRNQSHIAEALKVPRTTIADDFKAIDRMFQASAIADVNAEKGLDLSRIEVAILALMPRVERGDTSAIKVLLELIARKAKMLGFDVPVQVNVVDWRAEIQRIGLDGSAIYEGMVRRMLGHYQQTAAQARLVGPSDDDEEEPDVGISETF